MNISFGENTKNRHTVRQKSYNDNNNNNIIIIIIITINYKWVVTR